MYNREYYQMTKTNTTDDNYSVNTTNKYYDRQAYAYGNVAREIAPEYEDDDDVSEVQKRIRENRRKEHYWENRARKSRLRRLEQSRGINFGACAALVATVIVMLYLCVDYISLNAQITDMSKTLVTKESEYNALKSKNDSRLKEVEASIDLQNIYMIATRDLGMVFANKNQVITYENSESAYVRQYEDLPEESVENIFDDVIEAIQ